MGCVLMTLRSGEKVHEDPGCVKRCPGKRKQAVLTVEFRRKST